MIRASLCYCNDNEHPFAVPGFSHPSSSAPIQDADERNTTLGGGSPWKRIIGGAGEAPAGMRRDFADRHARRGRLERRDQQAECAGADRRRGADHVLSRHSAVLASRCRGKLGASGLTGRQNRSHRVGVAHTSAFQASDLLQRLGAFFLGNLWATLAAL